jgi:hypothetical protein
MARVHKRAIINKANEQEDKGTPGVPAGRRNALIW